MVMDVGKQVHPTLEKIYLDMPVAFQHVACSGLGFRTKSTRYGKGFWKSLEEAEERFRWPIDRVLEYRDQQLHDYVNHAATTTPYYRRLFREIGIDPKTIRRLDDLKKLPIMTKPEVKANHSALISEAVPVRMRRMMQTSGTTGSGMQVPTTLLALQQQSSMWWRYRGSHGIKFGTPCGYFGGRNVVPAGQSKPPFWRYNVAERQIIFSGNHMSAANLPHYVNKLRRAKPRWLIGYPSLLTVLSKYIRDTGADLGYQVQWISLQAENALPHQRELIESVFGAKTRTHYGMTEAVVNISERPDGSFRVDEDFSAVEFVRIDGSYRVVGTNFTNPVFPLLRYDTRDMVRVDDEPNCDGFGREIMGLDGRQEDYVLLPDGTRVGRTNYIFRAMTNIREAQIRQQRVEEVVFRVVRGADYSIADEKRLIEEARRVFGDAIGISVEYVERLERGRNGKHRLVLSDLKEGKLAAAA